MFLNSICGWYPTSSKDNGMIHEVKQFLSKIFDMKDMGDVSYVIGIKIHWDIHQGTLGLSQESYINKILERFWIKHCSQKCSSYREGWQVQLE